MIHTHPASSVLPLSDAQAGGGALPCIEASPPIPFIRIPARPAMWFLHDLGSFKCFLPITDGVAPIPGVDARTKPVQKARGDVGEGFKSIHNGQSV